MHDGINAGVMRWMSNNSDERVGRMGEGGREVGGNGVVEKNKHAIATCTLFLCASLACVEMRQLAPPRKANFYSEGLEPRRRDACRRHRQLRLMSPAQPADQLVYGYYITRPSPHSVLLLNSPRPSARRRRPHDPLT